MTMLFSLLEQATTLVRCGKEFAGACPWCGGTDRFHYFPDSDRYWCIDKGRSGCGRKGDAIQFLRDYHGLSFHDARDRVRGNRAPEASPLSFARQSLSYVVEAEYRTWKTEQWLDKNEQIREADSIIESLEGCARFTLSAQEGQRLADLLSHWYAELDALCQEVDMYSPNPTIDDTVARKEWVATTNEGE
jgi:hypothetical protein